MNIRRHASISLLLLPLALLMFALGYWQLQRMEQKQDLREDFEDGQYQPLDEALRGDEGFSRIRATGRFDTDRHVLLDNMIFKGRAGVHVLTPFTTFSGTTILVNRGWKPLVADRSVLPDIWSPAVPVDITGILAPPPEHRQRLGAPDVLDETQWPQLVTYLDIGDVAAVIDSDLPNRVIWLDSEDPSGFEGRDWAPSTMTPEHHRAYAVQWFAMGFAALVIWVVLIIRRIRGHA